MFLGDGGFEKGYSGVSVTGLGNRDTHNSAHRAFREAVQKLMRQGSVIPEDREPLYIELAIVVDQSFYLKYNRNEVTQYTSVFMSRFRNRNYRH